MPNMRLTKLPAREQAPDIRNCNFEEVSLGYDEAMAVEDGDVVLVPKGYHPCAAVHGYELYYLNVMAGPHRIWKFNNAKEHEWMLTA